jgi:hypothetical protein
VRLHPDPGHIYREKVAKLTETLATPLIAAEALDLSRGFIDRIVVRPSAEGPRLEIVDGIVSTIVVGLGTNGTKNRPRSMSERPVR